MHLYKKKNGKNWYGQFWYKDREGKWKNKSVNTGVPCNKDSAKAKNKAMTIALQKKEEFLRDNGYDIMDEKHLNVIDYSNYLLADYYEYYKDVYLQHKVRASTLAFYDIIFKAHIIPIWGNIKMQDMNKERIRRGFELEFEECRKKMANNKPNYIQSIEKHYIALSTMLDFAVTEGTIEDNPAPKVKKIILGRLKKYKKKKEKNWYSLEELKELERIVRAANTHIESAVVIVIHTGIRREEVLGLRWRDIDLNNRIIHIRHTCIKVGTTIKYIDETKTSKSRRDLPIDDDLMEYLIELKEKQDTNRKFLGEGYINTDYVCVWPDGKPIKPDNLSRTFNKILKENNLPKIRFHDVRASYGSVVYDITKDIKLVSDLMGHSNIGTTADIYVHTSEEHMKDAIDIFKDLCDDKNATEKNDDDE